MFMNILPVYSWTNLSKIESLYNIKLQLKTKQFISIKMKKMSGYLT